MTMLRCYIGSPYQFLDIDGVAGIIGDCLPLILSSSCLLLSTHSPLWGLGSHMVPRSRAVSPVCVSDAHPRYGGLGGHMAPRSRVVSPACVSDTHLRYGGLGGHIATRSRAVWPVCITDTHLRYGTLDSQDY